MVEGFDVKKGSIQFHVKTIKLSDGYFEYVMGVIQI